MNQKVNIFARFAQSYSLNHYSPIVDTTFVKRVVKSWWQLKTMNAQHVVNPTCLAMLDLIDTSNDKSIASKYAAITTRKVVSGWVRWETFRTTLILRRESVQLESVPLAVVNIARKEKWKSTWSITVLNGRPHVSTVATTTHTISSQRTTTQHAFSSL